MTLQAKLDAFRADFETRRPAEVTATMKRATAALRATGQAARAIGAGDRAPAFALQDADGQLHRSQDLLQRGPLVLSFYRGVWCPYCNMELQALQSVLPDIQAAGATLLAISPQNAANGRKSARQNALGFPILVDPANEVAHSFGLRFALPDELVALYRSFGNDLAVVNGDDSWTLPMPARYVIGQDGVVLYANVEPDYTQRPEPELLLPLLRAREAV